MEKSNIAFKFYNEGEYLDPDLKETTETLFLQGRVKGWGFFSLNTLILWKRVGFNVYLS